MTCEHKTSIVLTTRGNKRLVMCDYGCDEVFVDTDEEDGTTSTETAEAAGCPADYLPNNCLGFTHAAVVWFEEAHK